MNIEFNVGFGRDAGESSESRALNIVIVGNYSGTFHDGEPPAGDTAIRNMLSVDALDIDSAVEKLRPRLSLQIGDNQMDLQFSDLDDFHPDNLYRNQPAFATISELKQSLADPGKAEAASILCRELLGLETISGDTAAADRPQEVAEEAVPDDDMFSRLLGRSSSKSAPGNAAARAAVARILDSADVDADAAPEAAASTLALQDSLDAWTASAMRELLGTPEFQDLEASWRSVQWLGERIDLDEPPSFWLVDVGAATAEAWSPELRSRIVQNAGSVDLLIVLHTFTDTSESLQQLRTLAQAASELNTRMFAAASATLVGQHESAASRQVLDSTDFDDAETEEWTALRSQAAATRVALGFPRVLLRQPYGKMSDPIDTFDFEELQAAPDHEAFLWANPAIALAVMSLQDEQRVEDLPMVMFDDGTGQAIKPASEFYLTDSAVEKLLQRGFIPLTGNRGRTDVRVPRLQSIASSPTAV
ncbi:MAG: type VI secretion system contractile sheath large subunit [Gammaproteobacteria bacterium]|nr:type VI secretion system contractile sheath large subunit [Gammaproteobacteria bacterium]MDH3431233.1 type VI secretion system contractile sheath large subunit [Gammaproteobacteria bacterium]